MSAKNRNGGPDQSRKSGAQAGPKARSLKPGLELRGKYPVGRDPRQMTREELQGAGHEPMSPLQALRARCLDCSGGQENEVAHCTATDCPAWPFRMGADPWRKPASPARREAARRSMAEINARRRKRDGAETPVSPREHGIAPSSTEGSGVGLTWNTDRVERRPETERHRENENASGQDGDQSGDGLVADDDDADTTTGEGLHGEGGL